MSFYKIDYLGQMISATTVLTEEYSLRDSEDGPQDGWQWFDNDEEAMSVLLPDLTQTLNDKIVSLQEQIEMLLEKLSSATTIVDIREAASDTANSI